MDSVILTRELTRRGFVPNEVARMSAAGDLERVRRGAYVEPTRDGDDPDAEPPDEHAQLVARHRALILGTVAQLHPRAVVSHGSAAVLHGLPTFPNAIAHAHISRDRSGGGAKRSFVHVHGSPLPDGDVVVVDGVAATSLARTVADLARTLRFDQAVAVGDQALRIGLHQAELAETLEGAARWAGIRQARRVADFLDARSESVGESFSRVRMHELGLPVPEPQYNVFDHRGLLVGRCDFGWPDFRTLAEFDGKEKYLRLRLRDEAIEEAVIREKLREDALRDLGWQVVRWIWAELFQPQILRSRIERAFARGQR